MSMSKSMDFSLPEKHELPDTPLQTTARFDGVALAEELREGVELLLASRQDDPDFLREVSDKFRAAREILEGVEGGETIIEALRPSVESDTSEETTPATWTQSTSAQPQEQDQPLRASMPRRAQSH